MFNFNKELLTKIKDKKFDKNDFYKFENDNLKVEKISLSSINEKTIFSTDSIKLIYAKPKKSFALINDSNKNIYLAYIEDVQSKNLKNADDQANIFSQFSDYKIKNNLYISYDNVVNKKYKIEINEKTLERVKNNFN